MSALAPQIQPLSPQSLDFAGLQGSYLAFAVFVVFSLELGFAVLLPCVWPRNCAYLAYLGHLWVFALELVFLAGFCGCGS